MLIKIKWSKASLYSLSFIRASKYSRMLLNLTLIFFGGLRNDTNHVMMSRRIILANGFETLKFPNLVPRQSQMWDLLRDTPVQDKDHN